MLTRQEEKFRMLHFKGNELFDARAVVVVWQVVDY